MRVLCVGEEAGEVRGIRRCELLLDFLAAGEVSEDGRAFDGCGALEVEAGGPGFLGRVFGGGVPRAEVAEGDFVGGGGGVRGVVDQGAVSNGGDGCLGED